MSAPNKSEPNDDIGRASKAAAALGAVFALAALSLYGTRSAISVVVGVVIAVANLLTMRAIIRALIQGPEADSKDATGSPGGEPEAEKPKPDHVGTGRRGGIAWGVFAVLKIFILFGGVWILLTRGLVDPIPLVVGYGVLPLGIAASSLWSSLSTRR
jgi:hypothetical protein